MACSVRRVDVTAATAAAMAATATVRPDRLQDARRIGHNQLRVINEKRCDGIEVPIIDAGGVSVHDVGQGCAIGCRQRHVDSDRRCEHADRASLAASMSVTGGMASTIRSAP